MKTDKMFAYVALLTMLLQVVVVVVSWLITAAYPGLEMRSLLSGEGIRWLVGRFVYNLTSPILVCILLLAVSLGTVNHSGLWPALRKIKHRDYRERLALRFVMVEVLAFTIIMLMLTAIPHAILLNVTGHAFPSSFSAGIVPMTSLLLCVASFTYGFTTDNLHSVVEAFKLMTHGVKVAAPVFVVYIMIAELYHSVCFVFIL